MLDTVDWSMSESESQRRKRDIMWPSAIGPDGVRGSWDGMMGWPLEISFRATWAAGGNILGVPLDAVG